jgi:glycosyltransferase involved in cell wall biosynthesis
MKPLFTIITPTLNAGSTLADALASVRDQTGEIDFEHLLLDGGSTDDTLKVAAGFDFVATSSEKDRGLYDAMNKGAAWASGEWLVFLQADDWLALGALAAWAAGIKANPGAQVVTGVPERFERRAGAWVERRSADDIGGQELSVCNIALGDPMLNARTIRKDAFHAAGGFSLDYPYCSDRDFLLQLHQHAARAVSVPEKVYRYRWHEGSRTMNDGNELAGRVAEECLTIAERWMKRMTGSDRNALREWHANVSHQQVLRALEGGNLTAAFQSMRRAMGINPAWPAGFLAEFSRCFAGYVARGCRTKSQVRRKDKAAAAAA